MKSRVVILTLPLMCAAGAVVLAACIPLAVLAMLVMLVKPSLATSFQESMQKRMVRQMFTSMTKKAAARV